MYTRDPRATALSTVFGHGLRDLCHRNAIYALMHQLAKINPPTSRYFIQYEVCGSTIDLPTQDDTRLYIRE